MIAWEDNGIAYRDKHGKYHVAEGWITPDSLRTPGCDCPDCIGGCGWCPRKDGGKRPRKKCNRCGRGRYLARKRKEKKRLANKKKKKSKKPKKPKPKKKNK